MNCEACQLKDLEVEHFEIREILRCVLHTILFHRALGLIRPKDVDLELFDITYVQCGDVELEKKIDEKIEHFISWVEKHPNKKSQICLSFYEVKSKQPSWFTNKTERLYWEQWYVNLNVTQHPKPSSAKSHHTKVIVDTGEGGFEERSSRRASLEASLREVLFQIIKFVNEKKDHVPPISEGVIYFPYEITIPRFRFRDGRNQEDAADRASNYAQLITRLRSLLGIFLNSEMELVAKCRTDADRV